MEDCLFCKKSINKRYGLNRHYKTCKEIFAVKCIIDSIYADNSQNEQVKELTIENARLLSENKTQNDHAQQLTIENARLLSENKLQNDKIQELTIENTRLQVETKSQNDKCIILEQTIIKLDQQIDRHQSTINKIASQNKSIHYINNGTNNMNTNTTNSLTFNTFKNMTQPFINSEMETINLRNACDPFLEISNQVNNSQIAMNLMIKDRARNRIIYKDENSKETNDITKLGKMIHKSIEPKIIDVKYSNHKENDKRYRTKINELAENNDRVYLKIIRNCIQSFKSNSEMQSMRETINNKLSEISDTIKTLYNEHDIEGYYHLKYGIDSIFCYILKGLHNYIYYKNNELFIHLNNDTEIQDSDNEIIDLIYELLEPNTKFYIKSCKRLIKSCSDYEGTLEETIDLLTTNDSEKIKARIQNQIDALSLLNYDDD